MRQQLEAGNPAALAGPIKAHIARSLLAQQPVIPTCWANSSAQPSRGPGPPMRMRSNSCTQGAGWPAACRCAAAAISALAVGWCARCCQTASQSAGACAGSERRSMWRDCMSASTCSARACGCWRQKCNAERPSGQDDHSGRLTAT